MIRRRRSSWPDRMSQIWWSRSSLVLTTWGFMGYCCLSSWGVGSLRMNSICIFVGSSVGVKFFVSFDFISVSQMICQHTCIVLKRTADYLVNK